MKAAKDAPRSLNESMLTEELRGFIALLLGCQGLGIRLDAKWVLDTLGNVAGGGRKVGQAKRLQACSAEELAGLAGALCALSATPSVDLIGAYGQAVWPKLGQMAPRQVMQVLNGLVSWEFPFPTAMAASFTSHLSSVEVRERHTLWTNQTRPFSTLSDRPGNGAFSNPFSNKRMACSLYIHCTDLISFWTRWTPPSWSLCCPPLLGLVAPPTPWPWTPFRAHCWTRAWGRSGMV